MKTKLLLSAFLLAFANFLLPIFSFLSVNSYSQTFTEINTGIVSVFKGVSCWVDYDNDGDLDIFTTGLSSGSAYVSKIYNNNNGVFTDINANIISAIISSSAWGDYDNDGDMDLCLTGYAASISSNFTKIYQNNNGIFTEVFVLPGIQSGNQAWVDIDNDGDLDIIISGTVSGITSSTLLYMNTGNGFVNSGLYLGSRAAISVGDFDNDQDVDFMLNGTLYNNNGSIQLQGSTGIFPPLAGQSAWADQDSDGDLDIVLTGTTTGSNPVGKIFNNQSNNYSDINAGIMQGRPNAAWGDCDNDGDLDLLLNGLLYHNKGNNVFGDTNAVFKYLKQGSLAWGDYDNDGDLDVLISGDINFVPFTKLYRNNSTIKNTRPSPPTGLYETVNGNSVTFNWAKASDAQTSQNGLSYNMRVGTTLKGTEIMPVAADLNTGITKLPAFGNTFMNNKWKVKNIAPGKYYWSVQAIDNNFSGSLFSVIDSFVISTLLPPPLISPADKSTGVSVAPTFQWGKINGALSYNILVSYSALFTDTICYQKNISDTFLVSPVSLTNNAFFYWEVSANNASGTGDWSFPFQSKTGYAFSDINSTLPGITRGYVALVDVDNDGDLDAYFYGDTGKFFSPSISFIAMNDSGKFIRQIDLNIPGSYQWGDFDNDGDFDLISNSTDSCRIYLNQNMIFTKAIPWDTFLGGYKPIVDPLCDYDGDGDLDILLRGNLLTLFRKDSLSFFKSLVDSPAYTYGDYARWVDFDNDGDQDIYTAANGLMKNNNGTFNSFNYKINTYYAQYSSWADYDKDGDMDVVLAENDQPPGKIYTYTNLYANNNGIFTKMNAQLTGLWSGANSWGDYDNDGDPDLISSGNYISGYSAVYKTVLYSNNKGVFKDINAGLVDLTQSSSAWGDYDNDGDLDLFIIGTDYPTQYPFMKIYRNNAGDNIYRKNQIPSPPASKNAAVNGNDVILTWGNGADDMTPAKALSYNIRIGTTPDKEDIMPSMSFYPSGKRKLVQWGNASQSTLWHIKNLKPGKYYWAVQSIDNSFAGSPFSGLDSFVVSMTSVMNNVSCNGGSNGSATITTISSLAPYSFLWSNGQTTQTATGLTAGNYTVTIIDINIYTTTNTITITQPPALTSNANITNASSCSASDGKIISTVSGGTAPYTYLWSNSGSTPAITGLTQGTYTLTITDANSCTQTSTVTVTCPTGVVQLSAQIDFIVSPNPSNGTFTIETKEKIYEVIISNILGEKILSQQIQNPKSEIDLSKQPNGIYFLKIKTEQGTATQKLIINK